MSRINKIIPNDIVKLILNSRLRFIFPVISIGIFKLVASMWVYNKSLEDGVFHTRWMSMLGPIEPRWLYLFSAWDTSWYVTLANTPLTKFFSFERTFFPGYPIFIRLFGTLVDNYWLSAFMLSMVLGLAIFPIFQAIAEAYMSRSEAIGGTLLMAFFPYVFLFTTVAYPESLFLISVLATWFFYLKNRILYASLCSMVAVLTKTYGILIVLPMFLDLIINRKWGKAVLTLTPALIISIIVLPFTHKDLLVLLTEEINTATWAVTRKTIGFFWLRDYIVPIFTESRPMVFFHFFHAFALAFIILTGYLVINSLKVDWRLGIYSIAMFTVIIIFGFVNGLPRYISFIFPIWLVVKVRNPAILLPIIFLFYIHSLILWYQFLYAQYPI